ncbi:MAG: hypothetical protein QM764_20910 [Chitinophagaceae bacterium]
MLLTLIFIPIGLIATIILYRYFFVGSLRAAPNAEILGTQTKSTNIFHQFLVNPSLLRFKSDGVYSVLKK